jgi:hypothetical protein
MLMTTDFVGGILLAITPAGRVVPVAALPGDADIATDGAFYYVRVLEIPTPRWTAYDAKYYGVKMPSEAPMTTTERAYTSPIWYTP